MDTIEKQVNFDKWDNFLSLKFDEVIQLVNLAESNFTDKSSFVRVCCDVFDESVCISDRLGKQILIYFLFRIESDAIQTVAPCIISA